MSEQTCPPQTNERTLCVTCKSDIAAGAAVCPICKSYQSSWKRKLYYCATIAGLITVVISLLTYVASTWPEVRRTLFWKDLVDITAFNSMGKIVIYNAGDGKVFISHLWYGSEKLSFSGAIHINKIIDSKSFLVDDVEKPQQGSTQWGTGSFSEDLWQKMLTLRPANNECIRWFIYHPDDPGYQTIKAFLGKSFRTIPIDATLFFHSGRNGRRITRKYAMFGVPFLNRTRACGAPDSWLALQ